MKRLDIAVYAIVVLLGLLFVVAAQSKLVSAESELLLDIGSSIIASAIVFYLLLLFVGNPFDDIVNSLKLASENFQFAVERNVKVLGLAARSGLLGIWPNRSDLEISEWVQRLIYARREVFILAFAMEFLSEHAGFIQMLREKGAQGCKIRLIMGDPSGTAVANRNIEEAFEGSISSRIETTLIRLQKSAGPNVEIRLHNTSLYCAIYGFDDEMIVTPHLYGLRGASAPTLIFQKTNGGLFDKYKDHFENIWQIAY